MILLPIHFITGGENLILGVGQVLMGFSTSSEDAENLPSGSYILNLKDNDGCIYPFNFEITSSDQISYTASIDYTASTAHPTLFISGLQGGGGEYDVFVTTSLSQYSASMTSSVVLLQMITYLYLEKLLMLVLQV